MKASYVSAAALAAWSAACGTAFAFTVDAELPAGNVVVNSIDGDRVSVRQDLRDTTEDWFYWAFRVKGAAGRTVRFDFRKQDGKSAAIVGVRGPVVSKDRGRTFEFALDGKSKQDGFTYTFGPDEDETYFYECHPYLRADWDAFIARHSADVKAGRIVLETLCKSRKGADVPRIRVGHVAAEPKHRVLLTARHHCSETMASWVLEGFIESFLADDDLGKWLRENVELMMVPFVDYDGAQAGDQGKRRRPHDHNRDYSEFLYPETKAITEWIAGHAGGRLDVFIDVHCPWIRGKYNEWLYTPWKDPKIVPNLELDDRFSELIEKLQRGPLRYRAADDLPFGQAWNKGINYDQGWSSIIWGCNSIKGLKICRTFEVPFANANGAVVTPDGCREFGGDVIRALREILEPSRQ